MLVETNYMNQQTELTYIHRYSVKRISQTEIDQVNQQTESTYINRYSIKRIYKSKLTK